MAQDVIITPADGEIEWQDNTTGVALIDIDSNNNLSITNAGGSLSIGDGSSDVYIGNGIANVDLVFEQDGEIRGTGSQTLTLGTSGDTIKIAGGTTFSVQTDLSFAANPEITWTSNFLDLYSTNAIGVVRILGNASYAPRFEIYTDAGTTKRIMLDPGSSSYFDGTNAKLGIGTAGPTAPLTIRSTTIPQVVMGYPTGTNEHRFYWDSSKVYLSADHNNNVSNSGMLFSIDGSTFLQGDDNGDVIVSNKLGIGATPSYPLHVYRSGSDSEIYIKGASSGADARLFISGYESSEIWIDRNGVGRWALRRQTGTDDLYLYKQTDAYADNGVIQFWDYSSGNVGIGTDSPDSLLHVEGGQVRILDTAGSTSYGARLVVGRNTGEDLEFHVDDLNCKIVADQDGDSDGNHNFILDRSFAGAGDNNFQIQKGGTSQLLIDTNGSVGIGTTSPEEKLHVNGNVRGDSFGSEQNTTARIFSPKGAAFNGTSSTHTGYLILKFPDNGSAGYANMMTGVIRVFDYNWGESFDVHFAGYWYSGNNWTRATGWIDSQGDQDRNFTIRFGKMTGSSGSDDRPFITIGESASTWGYVKFSLISFTANHSNTDLEKWNSGWETSVGTSLPGTQITTRTNNQVNNWRRNGAKLFTNFGNVGIGRTDPNDKLEVAGNIRVIPDSGDAKIIITDQGVRNWELRVSDGSDYFEIDGTTSTSLAIKGDGNVGIGTVSPSAKLDVRGRQYMLYTGADATILHMHNDSATGYGAYLRVDNSDVSRYALRIDNGTSQNFTIPNSGGLILANLTDNVDQVKITREGYSTTHGDAKLFIYDNSNADWGQIVRLGGSSSYGLKVDQWVDYGFALFQQTIGQVFAARTSSIVINEDGGNYDFRVEGDTDVNLLVCDASADSVGIGTSSPLYKLSVAGDAYAQTLVSNYTRLGSAGTFSTSTSNTAGWYPLAKWGTSSGSRGGFIFYVSYTGGNHNPVTYVIKAFKNWSGDGALMVEKYGSNSLITDARIIADSSSVYHLELYLITQSSGHSFQVRYEALGYDESGTSTMILANTSLALSTNTGSVIASMNFGAGEGIAVHNALVQNNLHLGSAMYHHGDTDTYFGFNTNEAFLVAGSVNALHLYSTEAVVNENGANYNFRVEGDTVASLLVCDASADSVGIGTAVPQDKFHVRADGNASNGLRISNDSTGTSARTMLSMYNDSGSSSGFILSGSNYSAISGWANRLIINTDSLISNGIMVRPSTGGFKVSASGTNNNDLYVAQSSNVGIGTASPYGKLQVNGSTQTFNAHFGQGQNNGNGNWGGISLGYSENNNNYRKVGIVAKAIGDNAARQELHFLVDSVNDSANATITDSKMMIDINGNVGIGIVTPTAKIHIKDASGNPAVGAVAIIDRPNNLAVANQTADNPELLISGHSSNYKLVIRDQSSNELMAVKGNGNVGIGTASPGSKLHVNGGTKYLGGGDWTTIERVTTTENNYALYVQSTGTNADQAIARFLHSTTAGSPNVGTEVAAIKRTNSYFLSNLGVGTDSPSHKLQVNGTVSFRPNGSSNDQHYFTTGGVDNTQYIMYNSAGTAVNRFRTDNTSWITGGSVGIGTTSPLTNSLMTVDGGLAVGDSTYGSDMNTGRADFSVDCNGTPQIVWLGDYIQMGGTDQNWSMKASTGLIQTWSQNLQLIAGGTGTYRLYLGTSNNNVTATVYNSNFGLGTTTPTEKLHVVGNIALSSTSYKIGYRDSTAMDVYIQFDDNNPSYSIAGTTYGTGGGVKVVADKSTADDGNSFVTTEILDVHGITAIDGEFSDDLEVNGSIGVGGNLTTSRVVTITNISSTERPAIKIVNPNFSSNTSSTGKSFYRWLPIDIDGTTRWIAIYQ